MTTTAPQRIQLRRAKGWRMPANTVKVDRTTPWGNPFVVGKAGTRAECVQWFEMLLAGFHMGSQNWEAQCELFALLIREKTLGFPSLRGKNLACWCQIGALCHADILLKVVNEETMLPDDHDPESYKDARANVMLAAIILVALLMWRFAP